MSERIRRHSGGFTLVETLVAGVILALWAVTLGTTVSQSMRSLALARDFQQAAELLDETLTKIDMIGPARVISEGPIEGTFEAPLERFSWRTEIEDRTEGHLYEVTVRIVWATPGGQTQSKEAQTLLNDPPDSRPAGLNWDEI